MVFARTLPGKPNRIAQFQKSVFLGKSEESDACLVGTSSGTKVARTLRRCVEPYQAEGLLKVKGVPWDFSQEALGVKMRYRKIMPALDTTPLFDEEAEAVKKAAQELSSDDEDDPNDTLGQQLEEQHQQEVPKTPTIRQHHRKAHRWNLEHQWWQTVDRAQKASRRTAGAAWTGGDNYGTEESRKRGLEAGTAEQPEGSPTRARTSAEGSHPVLLEMCPG
eukprot:s658_g28.t1